MTKDTRFQKGRSGNPGGRPKGSQATLRAELTKEWPEVKKILLEKARGGDLVAVKIIADRVVPPLKAMEPPSPLALPDGTLVDKANTVIEELAAGEITVGQAAGLLQGIGALAKIVEVVDLVKRVEELEKSNAKS